MWNEKAYTFGIFQCKKTLPHTPSWGDCIVWTCTLKVHEDCWEALEIFEGFGQTTTTELGSMMEGYMVYQNMLYVSEYIPNLASKLNLARICDRESNNNFEGDHLKRKGRSRKVKGNY